MKDTTENLIIGLLIGALIAFLACAFIVNMQETIIVSGRLESFDNESFTIDSVTYHCSYVSNSTMEYYLGRLVEIKLVRNDYGGFDLRATKEL